MEGRKKCAPLEEGDYDSSERTKKVKLPYLSLKKKNSLLSDIYFFYVFYYFIYNIIIVYYFIYIHCKFIINNNLY